VENVPQEEGKNDVERTRAPGPQEEHRFWATEGRKPSNQGKASKKKVASAGVLRSPRTGGRQNLFVTKKATSGNKGGVLCDLKKKILFFSQGGGVEKGRDHDAQKKEGRVTGREEREKEPRAIGSYLLLLPE